MKILRSLWHACSALGAVQWFFLGCTILSLAIGYRFQREAFPKNGTSPFAQVSVTVYTRFNPARVLLKSVIEPNASQNDRLDITVKGPHGRLDPWLVVITCPHRGRGQVPLDFEGATQPRPIDVLAAVYDTSYQSIPLGCLTSSGRQAESSVPVVEVGENINLSLPVLEQSPLGQSATAGTPLYVVRGTTAKQPVEKLVAVLQAPEASCPSPSPSPTASPGSPQSQPAPSPSGPGTSCLTQIPSYTIATRYVIPTSVTTSEILGNVSLSGDRIDSMFPPGQISGKDEVIWQGVSGLSPSLSATSLSSAENASRAGFYAGLLYGFAAGLFVPFISALADALSEERKAAAGPPGQIPAAEAGPAT